LKASDYPEQKDLIERWRVVESHMREFLGTLQNDDMSCNVEFSIGNGPKHSVTLGALMHHAARVHHRGQVALLLRMLGRAPGNFDLLFYCLEAH